MTSEAVSAATNPVRPPWRALGGIAMLTLLWGWLTYQLPALLENGLAAMAVRLTVHALIALGLWLGLERTDLTPDQRRATWLAIMVPLTLWMAIAWGAAINGVFRADASDLPSVPMAIFLPVIVGAPLLLRSKRVGKLLDAMPAAWLISLQLYRVFGGQWLVYWLHGLASGVWALPAGAGDVLTGLFAVPAAIAVATGAREGARAAILWNVFGLADFVVAVGLGLITSPGPLQLVHAHGATIGAGTYPNVLTPAFVVPSSVLLHLLSLRQLRRRGLAQAARLEIA
jgi:hypothetical protein